MYVEGDPVGGILKAACAKMIGHSIRRMNHWIEKHPEHLTGRVETGLVRTVMLRKRL